MKLNSPNLFIIIDHLEISFIAVDIDEHNKFSLLAEFVLPIEGIIDNKISDLQKITNQLKKNILKIEEIINFTFKEVIIILNSFNIFFLNITGYKNLNNSQVSKENVTYIINSLKSCLNIYENKKKILHIFNTEFQLDKKKSDNIPIGLFGDLYSHELSFNLINENDLKNLKIVFDNCNIKIKKILTGSFVKGALISNENQKINTFFNVEFGVNHCKIFSLENDSIKYEQLFKFGTNLITKDVSKITKLNSDIVNNIIKQNIFTNKNIESDLLEQKFFENQHYRKVKKKLIFEIAEARILEFSEVLLRKNINIKKFLNKANVIYLEVNDLDHLNCFREVYRQSFSYEKRFKVEILNKPKLLNLAEVAFKISEYGWKTEAIPVYKENISYFTRFFRSIFS